MRIISQDKTIDVSYENNSFIIVDNGSSIDIICSIGNGYEYTIGSYLKKETAIAVLNQIHETYIKSDGWAVFEVS